jgi:hypothetical protein
MATYHVDEQLLKRVDGQCLEPEDVEEANATDATDDTTCDNAPTTAAIANVSASTFTFDASGAAAVASGSGGLGRSGGSAVVNSPNHPLEQSRVCSLRECIARAERLTARQTYR